MFTLTLAAAAFLIPVVGFIIDRCGYTVTYVLTVSFAVLWSSMLVSGVEQLLVPSFVCYALFRTFVFTFMFAYLADTMGFRYYGALSGLLFLICGLVGLLQYPVAHWARQRCLDDGGPCESAHWPSIHITMVVSFLFSYLFCANDYYIRTKNKIELYRMGSYSKISNHSFRPDHRYFESTGLITSSMHQACNKSGRRLSNITVQWEKWQPPQEKSKSYGSLSDGLTSFQL